MSKKREKEQRRERLQKRRIKKRKKQGSFSDEEREEPQRTLRVNEVLWGNILYTLTETGVRKELFL